MACEITTETPINVNPVNVRTEQDNKIRPMEKQHNQQRNIYEHDDVRIRTLFRKPRKSVFKLIMLFYSSAAVIVHTSVVVVAWCVSCHTVS